MRKRTIGLLFMLVLCLGLLPRVALAQGFSPTPDATLDRNGVLHWDAEGEYYSRIDLGDLTFGPDDADASVAPVDGEYSYDIENLFQAAEQLYGSIGDGDVSGLNDSHPVTFVYYEKQTDGSMKEVGRAEDAFTYSYTTGQLVKLATPNNLSWTGDDGFTASWGSVEHAEGYWVRFYETVSGSTSKVVTKKVEGGTTCELTSLVPTPKDGATYAFEVRANGPTNDAQYVTSGWSTKSAESAAWKTPVVEYGLTVGGVDVTSANAADVLNDGTVSYDPSSQTLTLNNAEITDTNQAGLAIETDQTVTVGPVTIELIGKNSCGSIWARWGSPLTITGEGSLTVKETALGCAAVQTQESTVIDGATLTVTAKEGGIHCNGGNVAIKNGAQVSVNVEGVDAYYAVWAEKDVEVTGENTKLVATTNDTDALVGDGEHYSIYANTGTVTIGSDAYVEAGATVYSQQQLTVTGNGTVLDIVGTAAGQTAVLGQATVSIEDGAKVEATGRFYGASGISVTNSSLTVDSIGDYFAIDAQGPITATNSALNATSNGTIAVYIWDNDSPLTFTISTVTATSANSYALYAPAGGIEVSGGSLTLNAPKSYATYTTGDLVAKDGVQLTLTDVAHGLAAAGTVELSGATGTVTAGNSALYSNDKDVVIEGCSNLTLSGKMTVNAQKGSISIGGSGVNVSGTDAIYAKQDISITDSQVEVVATGRPIAGGSVTISGETTDINATGGWYIGASDELVISSGKVTVDVTTDSDESVMGALYGNNAVRISGGTVKATASNSDDADITYALMTNGVAEFAGGTITLEGGTGAIYVSRNGGSVSFGGNSKWYQWATSPTGAVTQATDDSYSYADDKSAYLRFEPVGTTYGLTVENGEGSGSFAAGTQVSISADAYDAEGHFTGWTVTDDSTGAGVLADATSASTTFIMPVGNVTLAATYEDHSLAHHEAVAPTCTDDGTLEYWECDGCGALFSDEAGTALISEEDLVDPATGHHYENGVCTGCGERQPGQVTPPSNPTYPPETGETENGEVTVTPSRPHEGDEVTIEPVPDEGFEVGGVTVTDEDGNPVEVTDNGDGTWTFVQPGGRVTVTVTFACDGGDLCPTRGFADVDQDAWYHGAVDWAVTGGVINGYGDGSGLLGPLNPITRAEVAQVLWNLAGRPGAEADLSTLPDVGPSGWYAGAVAWCLSEGVFEGYGDIFGTGRAITREELATVLWRLSGAPEPAAGLSSFSDAGSVSEYATGALSWAVESGVVTGKDDGTRLDPQGTCTRAEAAAMLMRLFAE